jgi:hypothetical protein
LQDVVEAVRVDYCAVDVSRFRSLDRRRARRERNPPVGEVPGDLG